jgi:hypothetical protein
MANKPFPTPPYPNIRKFRDHRHGKNITRQEQKKRLLNQKSQIYCRMQPQMWAIPASSFANGKAQKEWIPYAFVFAPTNKPQFHQNLLKENTILPIATARGTQCPDPWSHPMKIHHHMSLPAVTHDQDFLQYFKDDPKGRTATAFVSNQMCMRPPNTLNGYLNLLTRSQNEWVFLAIHIPMAGAPHWSIIGKHPYGDFVSYQPN